MHGLSFLHDLAVVMLTAGATTILCHVLRQPVILGYLLAGFIVGPNSPPFSFIHNEETIRTLGELGLLFIMFTLGLEFNLRKLRRVGVPALLATPLEVTTMFLIGFGLGKWFGWPFMECIFLGAMISISSTTVITRTLEELGKMSENFAQIIFGVLIFEDIIAIILIALLSGFASSGSLDTEAALSSLGTVGMFLAVVLVGGLIVVPRLFNYIARFRSDETLLISALALCFGIALLAAELNCSIALGGFLIGATMAETRQIGRIEMLMHPLKDMFSAIFFVTVGMHINVQVMIAHATPIFAITAAVILGNVVFVTLGAFLAGYGRSTSLKVGLGLAQIGEFSFIIAALGVSLGVVGNHLYSIAVTISALTTLLTPFLIRHSNVVVSLLEKIVPESVVKSSDFYTSWVEALGKNKSANSAAPLLRKMCWQVAINLFLIAALFATAAYLRKNHPEWFPHWMQSPSRIDSVLWFSTMLISLALYIPTFRKLQAMGMLIGCMTVVEEKNDSKTLGHQMTVSNIFLLVASILLAGFTFALSAAILPPPHYLAGLITVVIVLGFTLQNPLNKLYTKAQLALIETFAQPPAPRYHRRQQPDAPLLPIFEEAGLDTIVLPAASPFANQSLSVIPLRSQTGATIVGIERNGHRIINPGNEESLLPGDRILLLGLPNQLAAAKELLLGQSTS
jgi:CPA2 family monovalent cation:H+ antiporter-2